MWSIVQHYFARCLFHRHCFWPDECLCSLPKEPTGLGSYSSIFRHRFISDVTDCLIAVVLEWSQIKDEISAGNSSRFWSRYTMEVSLGESFLFAFGVSISKLLVEIYPIFVANFRYFKLLLPVHLPSVKLEVRDLCVLRLVHAFAQSAPLLLVELHLLLNENLDQVIHLKVHSLYWK